MHVELLEVNNTLCYIVRNEDTRNVLVIDPAEDKNKIEASLVAFQPVAILLTHHHDDHVNLVDFLSRKYNIPVLMSHTEVEYYSFSCNNLLPIKPGNMIIKNFKLDVHSTPGHTKGSVCYHIEDCFFSGDTLFIETCGFCDIEKGGSPEEMYDSIQLIKKILKPTDMVYPGHTFGESPEKTFDYLLFNNIYLSIDDKQEFVKFRMRTNKHCSGAFLS